MARNCTRLSSGRAGPISGCRPKRHTRVHVRYSTDGLSRRASVFQTLRAYAALSRGHPGPPCPRQRVTAPEICPKATSCRRAVIVAAAAAAARVRSRGSLGRPVWSVVCRRTVRCRVRGRVRLGVLLQQVALERAASEATQPPPSIHLINLSHARPCKHAQQHQYSTSTAAGRPPASWPQPVTCLLWQPTPNQARPLVFLFLAWLPISIKRNLTQTLPPRIIIPLLIPLSPSPLLLDAL